MLTLSQRERDRLVVVRQVCEGSMKLSRGAKLVGLSPRQFRRLRQRFLREGDAAVVHGLRGRRPNNAKPERVRQRVLERAREAVFSDFGPTLLAEHLSQDPEIGPLNRFTLRSWLIAEGRWEVRRRGRRHRKARPRRAAFGELIQWDSSDHAWFEDRYPGRLCLIQMHDDATNRLLMARFVPKDTGAANRQIAIDYLRRWGRPVAFYTDKAGHFGQETRPVSKTPLEERDAKRTESIISKALAELNIELILAHSPQAKGRVERDFGTSQDRLVKELRVRGISTIEEGNRFLEEFYIDYWNERFAVHPADPRDAHRRLPKKFDLDRLFAETLTRTVSNDFTIRLKSRWLQIPKHQARGIQPGQKLTIEFRLDGSTRFRHQRRYLELEPVAEPIKPASVNSNSSRRTVTVPNKRASAPPRPGPDHPWRQKGKLVANPWALARYRKQAVASSATSPNAF
jgi:hypothetical protein